MPKFSHHLFICGNRRSPDHPRGCCDPEGSGWLQAALKAQLAKHGLQLRVRANKAGCLDQCEHGPTVVIYPQEIWYGNVRREDVPRIVEKTVLGGEVLSDLLIPDELRNTESRRTAARDAASPGQSGKQP
jgi:(2Fe-2S) ferredoxin